MVVGVEVADGVGEAEGTDGRIGDVADARMRLADDRIDGIAEAGM